MYKIYAPDIVKADLSLTTSKSISNRLLIMQALCEKCFAIHNLSNSRDTEVLLKGLESSDGIVDIGHAGTSMRFLTAYFALKGMKKILTGSERMQQRPIAKLVEALRQLGANIQYLKNEGYPPLAFETSKLSGYKVQIDGSVSSQYITALLLIAPSLPQGLELEIKNKLVSRAYVKLTLALMAQQGIKSEWLNELCIRIKPQIYKGKDVTVEADWSSASYWFSIAALCRNSEIKLKGLQKNSYQGDSAIVDIFRSLGVETSFERQDEITLKQTGKIIDGVFGYDFSDCPDLVQTVTVACCMLGVPFRFTGAETLRVKETDRIEALQTELAKFGFTIHEPSEGVLTWNGKQSTPNKTIEIKTYDDHRMALAFAPCAFNYPGLLIQEPEVVVKSYPSFWDDLKNCGFNIKM